MDNGSDAKWQAPVMKPVDGYAIFGYKVGR